VAGKREKGSGKGTYFPPAEWGTKKEGKESLQQHVQELIGTRNSSKRGGGKKESEGLSRSPLKGGDKKRNVVAGCWSEREDASRSVILIKGRGKKNRGEDTTALISEARLP